MWLRACRNRKAALALRAQESSDASLTYGTQITCVLGCFGTSMIGTPSSAVKNKIFIQHHEEKSMTTIVENADSGGSAAGMVIGILLTVALLVGGFYFYNNGGMGHMDVRTTNVFPAAPAAPTVNITTPAAPAAPATTEPAPAQ
jgi:hypothetical protein